MTDLIPPAPAPTSGSPPPAEATAAAAVSASPFSVQIGQLYDGPFDLLLDLIRRRNIDIYDIPISAITTEYLNYLRSLREMDVEVAAEFLVVAATLIQIKSKMMLPADPVLPGDMPAADPRDELVKRLLEYEKFKQAASLLHQRQQIEAASWCRPGQLDFVGDQGTEADLAVGVYDLVATLQQMLERVKQRPQLDFIQDAVTVEDMMVELHGLLAASEEPVEIRPVFQRAASRNALLAIFLAILELVRLQVALLRQDRPFGEILLKRHRQFKDNWAAARAATRRPGESL